MSKAGLLLTFVGLEARANKPLNKIYPTLLSWHIYPHKDLTGQVPTGNSLTPWSSPLEHTSEEKVYPTSCISRGAYICEWTPQPQGQGLSTLLGKRGELPGQSARRRMSWRRGRQGPGSQHSVILGELRGPRSGLQGGLPPERFTGWPEVLEAGPLLPGLGAVLA